MRSRARLAAATLALAACARCAGPIEPVVDLTPWKWTWSQAVLGGFVIRYAIPDDPSDAQPAGGAEALAGDPVVAAMPPAAAPRTGGKPAVAQASGAPPDATRFASFRYVCAREDRQEDAECSVFLDFWLLPLEPPLAEATLPAWQERFERSHGDLAPPVDAVVRDARSRDWLHRALTYASGAAFSHYSRPLSAHVALAVTSYTTRAPDRLVARDLARDAIERVRIEAAPVRSR